MLHVRIFYNFESLHYNMEQKIYERSLDKNMNLLITEEDIGRNLGLSNQLDNSYRSAVFSVVSARKLAIRISLRSLPYRRDIKN